MTLLPYKHKLITIDWQNLHRLVMHKKKITYAYIFNLIKRVKRTILITSKTAGVSGVYGIFPKTTAFRYRHNILVLGSEFITFTSLRQTGAKQIICLCYHISIHFVTFFREIYGPVPN